MTQQVTSEKDEELLDLLELAKEGEQKLKEIGEMATELAQKCQCWYEEGMARRQKQE